MFDCCWLFCCSAIAIVAKSPVSSFDRSWSISSFELFKCVILSKSSFDLVWFVDWLLICWSFVELFNGILTISWSSVELNRFDDLALFKVCCWLNAWLLNGLFDELKAEKDSLRKLSENKSWVAIFWLNGLSNSSFESLIVPFVWTRLNQKKRED